MNPLLNMLLASIFNELGIGNRNPSMPNQNGAGQNQMGGMNPNMMMNGNPLLSMIMSSLGGGMNPMNGNPLMNMFMGNNNNMPFNNGNPQNMNNMNNMGNMGNMNDMSSILNMLMGNQSNMSMGNTNNMSNMNNNSGRNSHSKK